MGKVKRRRDIPVNPFSTGGGGTYFELLVAAYYIAEMLSDKVARGLPEGPVGAVELQQRNRGRPVDDVIVIGSDSAETTLSLQVKHGLSFTTGNRHLADALAQCWRWFTKPTFDPDRDTIGIAFDEASNIGKVRQQLPELFDWARKSKSAATFIQKALHFSNKRQLISVFQNVLGKVAGRAISQNELWRFFRVFIVISFDFGDPTARDATDLTNTLRNLVANRNSQKARQVLAHLFKESSEYAQAGGEITTEKMLPRLPPAVRTRLPASTVVQHKPVASVLRDQVSNELQSQQNSRKYIPALFVESGSAKDVIRAFCNPLLFLRKATADFAVIDTSFLNRLLVRLDRPLFDVTPPGIRKETSLFDLPTECDALSAFCDRKLADLRPFREGRRASVAALVSKDKAEFVDDIAYPIGNGASAVSRALTRVNDTIKSLRGGVFILRAAAGQGKTNFVCDLSRTLLRLELPCIFLTGKELRNAPLDDLNRSLFDLVIPRDWTTEEKLQSLHRLCHRRGAPLTIIIDAINEHPNLPQFAQALEQMISKLLNYGFVRIILTCRSEYFEHRFDNIAKASFADRIQYLDDIHERMEEDEKDRLLFVYLKFFRLSATFGGPAERRLKDDPLLLRIFCEAYGGFGKSEDVALPLQIDIYKDSLFEHYLSRKYEELRDRRVAQNLPVLGSKSLYHELLMKVVGEMLRDDQLKPIAIGRLDATEYALLEDLLHEDMIVRKDLASGNASGGMFDEVIAFPFDELRDYLIAHYLTERVFTQNEGEFIGHLERIVQPRQATAEGVARFVVYAAKRSNRQHLYDVVQSQPWFKDVFLDCVFGVEDELVTEEDVAEVKRRFVGSARDAAKICFQLIHRWRPAVSQHLGIPLLFEVLEELSDEQSGKLVAPVFDSSRHRFLGFPNAAWPVEQLTDGLVEMVGREISAGHEGRIASIVELLLFLLQVPGQEGDFPARTTFIALAARHRQTAWRILARRLTEPESPCGPARWNLAGDMTRAFKETPPNIFDMAVSKWRNLPVDEPSVTPMAMELAEYLEAAQRYGRKTLPSDIRDQLVAALRVRAQRWA